MNNIVNIRSDVLSQILKQAKNHYPYECCGILLGGSDETKINEIVPAKNSAAITNIGKYFEIDPLFLYRVENEAESKGCEVVGFFHSHPDKKAILSKEDEKHMIPGNLYIIVSVINSGVYELKAYYKKDPDEIIRQIEISITDNEF